MAHTKNKNKRKPIKQLKGKKDMMKVGARYEDAKEALKGYSSTELRDIYQNGKMSSTDKQALIEVTRDRMTEEMAEKLKEKVADEVTEEEEDTVEG